MIELLQELFKPLQGRACRAAKQQVVAPVLLDLFADLLEEHLDLLKRHARNLVETEARANQAGYCCCPTSVASVVTAACWARAKKAAL
ncbi:hypothetical protein JTM58_33955, partial [Pseudomonas aeruginosa]|nr:hypothetical protein [Pseudomonas aeruginosa]